MLVTTRRRVVLLQTLFFWTTKSKKARGATPGLTNFLTDTAYRQLQMIGIRFSDYPYRILIFLQFAEVIFLSFTLADVPIRQKLKMVFLEIGLVPWPSKELVAP